MRATRPVGIADAEMAPVLGPDGKPLAARGWYDTESIAEDGGTVWLGIERVNRIVRFDIGRHGLLARGQPIAGAAGHREAAEQQGARMPRVRAARPAARRHADRDLGARARCRRQHPGLPDRRPEPRRVLRQAHRRVRRQRLRDHAGRRSAGAGAQLLAPARRRHAHPPRAACRASSRARSSTGRRCSKPTWAIRSTTWKGCRCIAQPTARWC